LNIPGFIQGSDARPEITWVVKREKLAGMPLEQVRYAEEHFYYFRNDDGLVHPGRVAGRNEAGRRLDWLRIPTGDFLYHWTSIAQPAVNLAANMGARNIILVGCDNASLLGNHHSHEQHARWLGATPDQRYRDYYDGLAEVRSILRERGVNVVSVTPFLTL